MCVCVFLFLARGAGNRQQRRAERGDMEVKKKEEGEAVIDGLDLQVGALL